MIYEIAGWIGYTIGAGVCLVMASVFVALSLMVVKSGWEADTKRPDSSDKKEYEPLRKDR